MARGADAPRATPNATPLDLRRYRTTSDRDLADRLHPAYADAIGRVPAGDQVLRGLPFRFARSTARRRWLLLDRGIAIDLRPAGVASHIVVAHFCDTWRDPAGDRPADLPVGWVTPVGQPLAKYTLETARGGNHGGVVVRRRFEINEGIVGWGQGAFAAVPHPVELPLDWRGPHPVPAPGGYAAPGHAGLLGILPGSWGPGQTGVADSVPSPTGDIALWLYAIAVPGGPAAVDRLRLEPLASADAGGAVVVAAVTVYRGTASPLAIEPRRTLHIAGAVGSSIGVDLGQLFRTRAAPTPPRPPRSSNGAAPDAIVGWGESRIEAGEAAAVLVDLALAPDARLTVGSQVVPADRLPPEGARRTFGRIAIEALPAPAHRVEVEVIDSSTGRPVPARVRFLAPDGRYLPPLGHRDEVNPGLNEDTGADLVLGAATYAYVPGRFPIALPAGRVELEIVRGFGYRPLRRTVDVSGIDGPLVLPLERAEDPSEAGWIAVDCHVHFISPTSALLQARAEGVAIANLLATQWGDHHTSIADLPSVAVADPSGEHLVVMGSENRQNMLGHIGLLGAPEAVLPMASAGPPEARMGDPLETLLADWADASRAQGGLAVAVHFPLPYAEIAADIVSGRIDAVELQALTPGIDGPSIREWYRFLNCGYRLPVVGGTDKMSAEIPLGAIRTYARTTADSPLSFAAWADAVRAGRTFVSSGAFVDLEVDGHGMGDTVRLGRTGGTVEVTVRAWSAQSVIDGVELVHDGVVVAATRGRSADRLSLTERVTVDTSGWLAARVLSDAQIHSGFATSMGAHSSPVYLDVPGRPAFSPDDAAAIGTIIDGARTWIETMATVRSPTERIRLAASLRSSQTTLDELIRERTRS